MNRIKRISMQLLNKHGDLFTTDYEKNKEILGKVSIFRSKNLRNEVAGYITSYVRAEMNSEAEEPAPVEEIAAADVQEGVQ